MVVFQKKPYGPEPPPVQLDGHLNRKRSLPVGEKIYYLQECSSLGRRPQVTSYIGHVQQEWFEEDNELFKSIIIIMIIIIILSFYSAYPLIVSSALHNYAKNLQQVIRYLYEKLVIYKFQ